MAGSFFYIFELAIYLSIAAILGIKIVMFYSYKNQHDHPLFLFFIPGFDIMLTSDKKRKKNMRLQNILSLIILLLILLYFFVTNFFAG